MIWLRGIVAFIAAYILGNISAGKIVSNRIGHVDITKVGSGNAGTTNVLRTLGWLPSILTLAGDVLKAIIAAMLGKAIVGDAGMVLAGAAVMLGHIWPVIYDFKGGKGIAAAFGYIIYTDPIIALILFVEQIGVIALTRYMSLASLVSCVLYAVLVAVFHWGDGLRIAVACFMAALSIFAHRSNIKRLLNREENRLDFRKINEISKKKK